MTDKWYPDHVGLIVVDVQNDFCKGGSLEVNGGDEIVPLINEFQKKFSTVVYTQDYHPKGHASFASTHEKDLFSKYIIVLPNKQVTSQVMWPDHCVEGTTGCEFHPELKLASDIVVKKGTNRWVDSYSGFGDAYEGKFEKTDLFDKLHAHGVSEVVCVGLAFDYCVGFTAMDAVRLGMACTIIKSMTRSVATESEEDMMTQLARKGVWVQE